MDDLWTIRRDGMRLLALICLACFAITAVGAIWAGSGLLPVVLAGAIPAGPAMLAWQDRNDTSSRVGMGLAVVSYPMIWLYQWSGHEFMIDIHMTFFAALAMLVLLADWRPVLAGAALGAAHHVLTNFFAPWLVYPDGSDFGRVVLHGSVVIVEAGTLIMLCVQLERLIVRQAEASAAREEAEAAAASQAKAIEEEQALVIGAIGKRLEALAAGNLSDRITTTFPPAYERLRESFNSAVSDLDASFSRILQSVGQIDTGSSEIRAASDDLARRTEEQASSLERNSASTRDLTGKIQTTAENAGAANRSISAARRDAEAGGDVVERAITAMNGIESSANEIAQIITIIDGIAFQTNLLALNAGVEAARAGDAGKGFAVVANEVRALAQRSADAARDIKALITASSEQVGQGVALVSETGSVLRTIVLQVREIGTAISAIAAEAGVQAGELRQVSETFSRIDSVTQQNAAMVEQSTAAAHSLQRAADAMKELVSRFRTSESASSRVPQTPEWRQVA
ncbi:MAG: hypothetical protein RIS94_3390 [Pseudomonadota bacterium]|jgi:methyl-accepting chemotaxis protein